MSYQLSRRARLVRVSFAVFTAAAATVSVSATTLGAQEHDPPREVALRRPRFLNGVGSSATPIDPVALPTLRRRVTLPAGEMTLDAALRLIARQTGARLQYSRDVVPLATRIRLEGGRVSLAAALTEVLLETEIDIAVTANEELVLVRSRATVRRAGDIVGSVTDSATRRGIPAAHVFLEGTDWRTTTDTTGWYRLSQVNAGVYTLVVRRLGYGKRSLQVTVREASDTVNLVLAPVALALDELVTTATGQQRRRDLGNAITTIRADSLLQAAPIRNLTDLLQDRVPGLTVQHTSGAPGDPARLRLRGISSALHGNDPVVIVDGARIYSTQSESRSGNLTNLGSATTTVCSEFSAAARDCTPNTPKTTRPLSGAVPAPSPLDQIDPNIIEKIEVFKGPSAATLYGADAANGVIVITTKKGRPGPTRWTANVAHGRTDTPGQWPTGYYRWGHIPEQGSVARFCTLTNLACVQDSLVQFQLLNDPNLTMLDQGRRTAVSLTASGGGQSLTYSVTGSYSDEIGLLKLPDFEAERFRTTFTQEVPDWMDRPHRYESWSVSSNVGAMLGPAANVSLRTTLSRSHQQRSRLEAQISRLAGTYLDRVSSRYYVPSTTIGSTINSTSLVISDFYQRTTASTLTFTTGLNATWRPRSWLDLSADAGLNVVPRVDEALQHFIYRAVIVGDGRSLISTANIRTGVRKRLGWGFDFVTNLGANLNTTTTSDLVGSGTDLQQGSNSFVGARSISLTEARTSTSVFGWYIEPQIIGGRLSLSTGLRLDGGSTHGTQLNRTGSGGLGSLLSLPKLNGSWVISEEPWFPFTSFFSSLRLRGAYGQAQVQPGPIDRLRIYQLGEKLIAVGNTDLRPERSVEFEGGFDADLLDSRISLEFTAYHKTQTDAHMPVKLPPSVNGGGSVIQNVGNIRNTGLEIVLGITPVQAPVLTWSAQLMYSHNTNVLIKLGDGVVTDKAGGLVEGYPLRSRWAKPILGYTDVNNNGVLERNEIRLGDSLVYMGRLLPDYTTAFSTNLALFGGIVGFNAMFTYDAGATQIDETARTNWVLHRVLVDPSAPFSDQASFLASDSTDYGLTQDVSTFRFRSLGVNYRAPARVARLLRAQQMTLAIQGSNLGLNSTYRGKDPDVSAWSAQETIRDSGLLPVPRTWQLAVFLQY